MDAKQLMLPGKIVKKSNALARARWSPDSIWEPRLVALLASQIKSGDTDFQTYELRLVDILGKEPGGKDYKELKEAVYKAMSRVITINDDKGWSMYNLFSKCRLDSQRGTLEICFHPDLKEHYLQLKQYMQYNIIEFMCLPSVYSQRLFEFLKSWDDRDEITIEIKELHEMLDAPKSFKANYKDFRRFVLEKAHKDILKFTEMSYTWEAIKRGRAVHAIKFVFRKKRRIPASKSPQAAALLQTTLSMEPPNRATQETARQKKPEAFLDYEKFLQRFPDSKGNRFTAFPEWNQLDAMGIAPKAEDVPANNELSIMEFLQQWKKLNAN